MEWVPIAVALIALATLIISRWPVEASLGTYAFLLPFDSVLIAGYAGKIHLHTTWFVGIAAVCILVATGLVSRGFLRAPRAALWLSLFVFWAGISFWWAIEPETTTFRLPVVALLLLLYFAAVCIPVAEKELANIGWLSILGACLASAISVHQFFRGQYYVPQGVDEPIEVIGRGSLWLGGVATSPNTLSATLILPLSLALGMFLSAHRWVIRLLMTGPIILISSCIYLTMSRGGLLASVVVLLAYMLRSRARWRLLVPIALIAAVVSAMPDLFFSRIAQTSGDRGAGRMDIWEVGLKTFKHYAVFGAGLDCFPPAWDKNANMTITFRGFARAPHNIYLGTGVELGAVGLLLLALFVAGHLRPASHANNNESLRLQFTSYEAACWGLLVCGFFLDVLWEEYFWFTLMLLAMVSQARPATRWLSYLQRWTSAARLAVPNASILQSDRKA